jgi:replicative DNA helicase
LIENSILSGLVDNEDYARKVLPFISEDYFEDREYRLVFEMSRDYIQKYNSLPTKDVLNIALGEVTTLNQDGFEKAKGIIESLSYDPKTNQEWLVEATEKFCQDRAIYNAVRKSILILDEEDKSLDRGAIPQILSDALGVSFDSSIGHDYIENASERFDFYRTKEDKIPFDIDILNKITKGGVSRKSISIILAGTGIGKTLFMCHCAAANMMMGHNVLYITMEMAEERISERIDANLLDVTVDELRRLDRKTFESKIERVKSKTTGKLVVKEYPTASAGANHFRFLLNELRLKKNFIPDIIYIDYLNICTSSRLKSSPNVNSYTYIKAIAEELRGLAVEFNVPVISATQTTRSGYQSSDLELGDTSESFGLPATADLFLGLMSTEELENLQQIMVKQLKNRWGDINYYKRFVVGIDRAKMRLYDCDLSAQDELTDAGTRDYDDKPKPKFGGFS